MREAHRGDDLRTTIGGTTPDASRITPNSGHHDDDRAIRGSAHPYVRRRRLNGDGVGAGATPTAIAHAEREVSSFSDTM
jgi:hypothetical protein